MSNIGEIIDLSGWVCYDYHPYIDLISVSFLSAYLHSYFSAKFLVEAPLNVLPCIVFGSIIYWIVGLNPGMDQFFQFLAILMLEALTSVALGLVISAFAPDVETANAFGPLPLLISLLFGGFFINIDSLPLIANLLPYTSFIRWVFQVCLHCLDNCQLIVSCYILCLLY